MTTNPILNELQAAKARVAELRAMAARVAGDLKVAEARLDAFEIAAKAFEDAAPKAKQKAGKLTRNRLPTEDWQKVFQALYVGWRNDFGYDEVMQAAAVCGLEGVKRPSLRTKMMNYADGGYVGRKDIGRFSITEKGIPYFKIEAQALKENGPLGMDNLLGGPETGEREDSSFLKPWLKPSDQTVQR